MKQKKRRTLLLVKNGLPDQWEHRYQVLRGKWNEMLFADVLQKVQECRGLGWL